MRLLCLYGLFLILLPASVRAQDPSDVVFDDTSLPTVRIELAAGDLARILAPGNEYSDVEYPATFRWESQGLTASVDSVGFRLRGNTSRVAQKKSFKVSFNTFRPGRAWQGLEKLNLNGEHNDPSIMRSKLAWDLMQEMGVPASRANHLRLFVNGEYVGLYINVEHVDEEFLKRWFGNDGGNLYKALYPADLTVRGSDGSAYRPTGPDRRPYDLTQGATDEEGYDDLAAFISLINNTSNAAFKGAIERAFNVDGFLRALAVTVLTGSWDSYWFLQNNYYLYHSPETGRWEYLPFDLDNSFGIWWDGIWPGVDWTNRDIYAWGHPRDARPLTRRILAIPEFRERYTWHLRAAMSRGFVIADLEAKVARLKAMTEQAAEEDPFRPLDWDYSVEDYHDSFTTALGARNPARQGHVTRGLLPFISQRYHAALGQLDGGAIAPLLSGMTVRPSRPRPTDPVRVTIQVLATDLARLDLEYWFNGPDRQVAAMAPVPGQAGLYAGSVPAMGSPGLLDLRVRAVDGAGQERLSALVGLEISDARPPIYINELMALNTTTVADSAGEFDDWVELYNAGTVDQRLSGLTLTDDPGVPDRWVLAELTVPAGGHTMLWLDGQPEQGPEHGPFRLSGSGEVLALYDASGLELDYVSFGPQTQDISWARHGDGLPGFGFAAPTPGAPNPLPATGVEPVPSVPRLDAYPNPFHGHLTITATGRVEIFDVLGRRIWFSGDGVSGPTGGGRVRWEAGGVAPGVYLVRSGGRVVPVIRAH